MTDASALDLARAFGMLVGVSGVVTAAWMMYGTKREINHAAEWAFAVVGAVLFVIFYNSLFTVPVLSAGVILFALFVIVSFGVAAGTLLVVDAEVPDDRL